MPRPANDQIEDVRYWLRQVFSYDCVKMTEGVELPVFRSRFLEILNHACPCSEPFLSLRQRDILTLLYTLFVDEHGDMMRLTVSDVAVRVRVDERTVRRDHRKALEIIAEHVDLID